MRRPDLDLSEFIPYLINRVGAALVERFTQDALSGTHLTIGTWRLLVAMSNHDGIRQVDLANLTSIEGTEVSIEAARFRRQPHRSRRPSHCNQQVHAGGFTLDHEAYDHRALDLNGRLATCALTPLHTICPQAAGGRG